MAISGATCMDVPEGHGVIDARAFILRDEDNRPRAMLALGKDDNEPTLTFVDKDGVPGATVGFLNGGSEQGIQVYDGKGEPCFVLTADEDGLPYFVFHHASRVIRSRMATMSSGTITIPARRDRFLQEECRDVLWQARGSPCQSRRAGTHAGQDAPLRSA